MGFCIFFEQTGYAGWKEQWPYYDFQAVSAINNYGPEVTTNKQGLMNVNEYLQHTEMEESS